MASAAAAGASPAPAVVQAPPARNAAAPSAEESLAAFESLIAGFGAQAAGVEPAAAFERDTDAAESPDELATEIPTSLSAVLLQCLLAMAPAPRPTATDDGVPPTDGAAASLGGVVALNTGDTLDAVLSASLDAQALPVANDASAAPAQALFDTAMALPASESLALPVELGGVAPAPARSDMPSPALDGLSRFSAPLPSATSAEWAEGLAERVMWMSGDADAGAPQEATIDLHPAEWGSLQIRVQLGADGGTQVSFTVDSPQARSAIESSLHRLRDALGGQGLMQFDVSGGSGGHRDPRGDRPGGRRAAESEETAPITASRLPSLRLLDHFA